MGRNIELKQNNYEDGRCTCSPARNIGGMFENRDISFYAYVFTMLAIANFCLLLDMA